MTAVVPNPIDSDSQYRRFHHFDLATMEGSELQDEVWALRPLLWWLLPSKEKDWLRERIARLEGELGRRRSDTGHGFDKRQKPKLAEGVRL